MIRFLPFGLALFLLVATLIFHSAIPKSVISSELTLPEFVDRILAADGKFDFSATKAVWFNKEVPLPNSQLAAAVSNTPETVLGQSTDQKWIEINLSTQRLTAHEGNNVVFDFPISSGLPWMPTVTGEFRIWAKIRSQRMTGGSVDNGTYYDLPNVPFVQYFYKGYGLHGAYWHNDFGKPRSHGCVNLKIADAEKLFFWTEPQLPTDRYTLVNIDPSFATRVVVHGSTPANLN